jgi:hypothetical protein
MSGGASAKTSPAYRAAEKPSARRSRPRGGRKTAAGGPSARRGVAAPASHTSRTASAKSTEVPEEHMRAAAVVISPGFLLPALLLGNHFSIAVDASPLPSRIITTGRRRHKAQHSHAKDDFTRLSYFSPSFPGHPRPPQLREPIANKLPAIYLYNTLACISHQLFP